MDLFEVAAKPPKRDKQIKFYATEQEREALHKVAEKLEVDTADLIRVALNAYVQNLKKRKKI